MSKCRLKFSKTDRARYISHLDTMRTFQRAFMRSNIPVKHTEGFNPHIYLTIALPLQLGCESVCEILDSEILDDSDFKTLPERLNRNLPEGLEVLSANQPLRKISDIKYLLWYIRLFYDSKNAADSAHYLSELFRRDNLTIMKKTKSGVSEFNLSAYIENLTVTIENDNCLIIKATLPAQNPTVNPSHLLQIVTDSDNKYRPDFHKSIRLQVFDANMEIFN